MGSDSWCHTLADQVPPVLAASTGGEGLRPPAGKVSLGRVQPGLCDAEVYPHTHAGTLEMKLMIRTERSLDVSFNVKMYPFFFKAIPELRSK